MEKAREAINAVFSDTSVSQEETKSNLQALKDDIDVYLDTLRQD